MDDTLSNSHHHHPASMLPPPMPAYLDPTAISSTKPSINTNQYFEPPFTTPIPPSISPLTSFANLSLLSPALLRSPSLLVPLTQPPVKPGMSTTTPTVPPPRDKETGLDSASDLYRLLLSTTHIAIIAQRCCFHHSISTLTPFFVYHPSQ